MISLDFNDAEVIAAMADPEVVALAARLGISLTPAYISQTLERRQDEIQQVTQSDIKLLKASVRNPLEGIVCRRTAGAVSLYLQVSEFRAPH